MLITFLSIYELNKKNKLITKYVYNSNILRKEFL